MISDKRQRQPSKHVLHLIYAQLRQPERYQLLKHNSFSSKRDNLSCRIPFGNCQNMRQCLHCVTIAYEIEVMCQGHTLMMTAVDVITWRWICQFRKYLSGLSSVGQYRKCDVVPRRMHRISDGGKPSTLCANKDSMGLRSSKPCLFYLVWQFNHVTST